MKFNTKQTTLKKLFINEIEMILSEQRKQGTFIRRKLEIHTAHREDIRKDLAM